MEPAPTTRTRLLYRHVHDLKGRQANHRSIMLYCWLIVAVSSLMHPTGATYIVLFTVRIWLYSLWERWSRICRISYSSCSRIGRYDGSCCRDQSAVEQLFILGRIILKTKLQCAF